MTDKRFYWLKLKEDFFQDEIIEWIEEQKNGKDYVLFYLKLCLKSLKNNGILIRQIGNIFVPYDVPKLAEITNTGVDTVAIALKILKEVGLIEIQEGGQIYMTQLHTMVGSSSASQSALKKRAQRDRKKIPEIPQRQGGDTEGDIKGDKMSPEMGTKCPTEYRDKSIEYRDKSSSSLNSNNYIDREGEDETTTANARHVGELDCASAAEAFRLWEKNIGVISPILSEKIRDLVKEVGYAAYSKAVNKAIERGKCNFAYISATAKGIAAGNDYDNQPKKGGKSSKNDVVGAKNAVLAMLKGEST